MLETNPLLSASTLVGFACTCATQQFIDLTLDNPDLSGLTPEGPTGIMQGPTSHILPGWTLTADGTHFTQMSYAPLGVGYNGLYATLTQNASSVDPVDIGPCA
jgi:hypothetical protein